MKVLNLLLAAAMVSSTFVMPVSAQTASAAETVENVIYETDFDDISSLGDLPYDAGAKTGWGYFYGKTGDKYGFEDSKYIDLVDEDGNKYLYTYQTAEQNGAENALYYDTSKITSGSIVADYDIKFDRENLTNMRIGYGMRADNMITSTGEVYNGYYRGGADKISVAPAETIKADTWYHVTMTADFDNDTMHLVMTDRDTQEEAVNEQLTGFTSGGETRALGINTIQYASGGSEKQGAYLDNVKITHVTEAAEPDPAPTPTQTADPASPAALPFNETFDYDSIEEMTAAGWVFKGAGSEENISKIEDGVLKLGLAKGINNRRAQRVLTPITSGILTAEWDVTPAEGVSTYTYFWGNGNNGKPGTLNSNIPVMYFDNGAKNIHFNANGTGGANIGAYTPGQTYHCKAEADFDNSLLTVTVTDSSGAPVGTHSGTVGYNEIREITFQIWAEPANDTWVGIDNVSITHKERTPETLPLIENFDYADINEMKANGWSAVDANNDISKIEDGVFKLGLKAGENNQQYIRKIEEVSSGRLKIECDITPVEGVCAYLWTRDGQTPVFFFQNGEIRTNGTTNKVEKIGNYTNGVTYHCIATLDLDNSKITATVMEGDRIIAEGERTGINPMVNQIGLQTWASPANDTWVSFDNLTVTHEAGEPVPTPTSDPSFEEVIYENDFDSVENLNDLDGKEGDGWNRDVGGRKDGFGNDNSIMLIDEGENKYLYVNHTTETLKLGDTVALSYDYPAVTTGQVIYDFDIMTDRTNMAFMRYGYAAHMDNSIMPNGEIYNSYWTNDKKKLTDNLIMPEKWYHVVITADLTSDYSTLYIEDKETGDKIVDVDIPGIDNHNLTRFEIAITDQAKENIGGAYLDNLKITRTTKPATDPRPMPEPAFKFEENFDSYADLDAMKANGWNVFSGYSTSRPGPNTEESLIIGDGTDKSFYLGIDANTDNIQAKKSFGTSITQGRALMEFDIIPGADTVTYVWMDGTGNGAKTSLWNQGRFSLIVFTTDGRVGVGASRFNEAQFLANYTAGEKYHCSIIIDIENDTFTAEIENEDGTLLGSKTISYKELAGTDIYTLAGLTLQEWTATTNTGSTFDNIVITKLPENTPVASIANTTFITDGEESSNYKEVSTLTDTIAVNFGAVMDLETLEGIKIVNSADSSEIAYTAEISGNSVNLNLAEALAPNAEYAIVIPAEAANIDGVVLGEETRLVFNTKDDASYSGAIKALTIDGNAVTNLSQIKAGTTLTADVKLDNATAEDKKAVVIFSFYNESGALVKTNYEVIDLKAGAKFDDAVEYTVEDMTDVAAAKVMLWDGFGSMRALDGCTTID